MNQLSFSTESTSNTRVIASSGVFQIELLEHVGQGDYPTLIEISKHLKSQYGEKAVLTKTTIQKYFNKPGSLPFIVRYRGNIIGYIIGVPLEELSHEPWARLDENFGKEKNKYKIWLDVEIAAAQAMEKLGQIPKGVSSTVRKKGKINVTENCPDHHYYDKR